MPFDETNARPGGGSGPRKGEPHDISFRKGFASAKRAVHPDIGECSLCFMSGLIAFMIAIQVRTLRVKGLTDDEIDEVLSRACLDGFYFAEDHCPVSGRPSRPGGAV